MDAMIPMPTQTDVVAKAPQSNLRLYSGVPWDNTYQHVRLYDSQVAALSSLESYRVLYSDSRLNNMAPIRVGSLELKIPFTEMETLDLNYMTFLNKGYSNTWVFAFITSIEWLSPETTRVHFELDIWQNNIYNCTMKPCFVERMHIPKSQDAIGGNLVNDSLETGEYICAYHTESDFGDMEICIYATTSPTGERLEYGLSNGVFRGTSLGHWPATDDGAASVKSTIDQYVDEGAIDAIVAFFMAPEICVNAGLKTQPGPTQKLTTISMGTPFGGYTPKNKKLYSYPYLYLMMDNNCGQSNTLFFEYSSNANHNLTVNFLGTMSTTPGVLIYPTNYKGTSNNYAEAITYQNFPMCSFNYDVYKSWLAYNQGTIGIQAVSSGMSVIGSAIKGAGAGALGGPAGAVAGGAAGLLSGVVNAGMDVANMMNTMYQKDLEPNVLKGKAMNTNLNAGANLQQVDFYVMSITAEFAKRIDDYWTVFGYPVHDLATPTMKNRSSWDYVKTVGCGLTGKVDLDQLKKLRTIFDNGVFIWHTNDIGNFGLANN